ncbi:5-formyltetrahydrofolate cyclo-ligase, mitochondrial [Tanacetum coccineum]
MRSYYHSFLSEYQKLVDILHWKQSLLIGLSFSMQIIEDDVIPVTETDILMDALVSPSGFIPISPKANRLVL